MDNSIPSSNSGRAHGQVAQGPAFNYPPDRKDRPVDDGGVSEQETFGNQQPFAQQSDPPYAPPQYEAVNPSAPFPSYQQDTPRPSESENSPFLQPQQPYAPYAPHVPHHYEQQPHNGPPQQSPYYPQHPQQSQYPNYGAIHPSAGGPSNPSPFPVGQRIDDHHKDLRQRLYDPERIHYKRKKRKSCCKKCCCWILILLVIAMILPDKKFNWFPGGIERCGSKYDPAVTFTHSFAAASESDLTVYIKGGLGASVKVVEAYTASQDQVRVKYDIYASDPTLAHAIKQASEQHWSGSAQDSGINMEDYKFPRHGCANVAVEISYPQKLRRTKLLNVRVTNGNIHYNVSKLTLESLHLKSVNGGIFVEAAVVDKMAAFKLMNGSIRGNLMAGNSVRADGTNGDLDLSIASLMPEKLDVAMDAINGRIKATLLQPFEGHFELVSINGRSQLLLPSAKEDEDLKNNALAGGRQSLRHVPLPVYDPSSGYHVEYKDQRSNVKKGWVAKSNKEPFGDLPRVHLATISGGVTLRLDK